MPLNISSPPRLLVLTPPDTPHPGFLKDQSQYEIRTPYYSASIPIWHDTLPVTPSSITAFQEEWSGSEAREVIQAIGAWVVCFRKPCGKADLDAVRSILTTIHAIIEHHTHSNYSVQEPLLLVVGVQQTVQPCLEIEADEWDDLCRESGGWEWIDGEIGWKDNGGEELQGEELKNEFGEKIGIPRLKEALEAHEWEGGDTDDLSDGFSLGSDDGFRAEAAEMEREMVGLSMAVRGEDGSGEGAEDGVEELESTMLKVQAIKDMGADMPDAERRRFAARAVRDVMKTL